MKDSFYKFARTFMPEIMYPGTGLSPITDRSKIPANNVPTIQDVLNGKPYKIPGAGGNWGVGEDSQPYYKDEGDDYKREERDAEIIGRMLYSIPQQGEQWTLKVPGGKKTFNSLPEAQAYKRRMEQKGVEVKWISRTRSAQSKSKQSIIAMSLGSTFKVVVSNYSTVTQSNGAAFCIGKNLFATCAHVLKSYDKTKNEKLNILALEKESEIVLENHGKKYAAKIINIDEAKDIALLEANIDAEPFILKQTSNIGDEIMTVGSPHGFENNASFGNVTSLRKVIYNHDDAPEYMFVDAHVFSGNSGGPIVDLTDGTVVGMVTAIASTTGEYGLNAGLPSYYIEKFAKNYMK